MMPIRRIAHNYVDASGRKHLVGTLHRQSVDADDMFQPVEQHAPPRHIRHIRLNFKRIDAFRAPHACQQQRQGTRPRAEISTAVAAFRPHEARQQYGIHAEAETLLLLQDVQPRLLQFVHPFAGQDGQFSGAISVNRLVRQ